MRPNSLAAMVAIASVVGFAAVAGDERNRNAVAENAGGTRRTRSPEQSAEKLSARQEKMARKAARRAVKVTP